VDEGNPDHLGQAMGPTLSCTDDNDGECGKTRGRCACSRIDAGVLDEDGDRDACTGEELSPDASSPRCVGAGQPTLERCTDEDLDCNGRPDDPEGLNLAERGLACGVARGSCTPGQVMGCDFSRPVANLALVQAQQPEFNPYWVCAQADGAPADLPMPEACNGKDDDCDGTLPPHERDAPPTGDGDGYLACSGCTRGNARVDLDPRYAGCGDCAPANVDVFPSQAEFCNQIDDNCSDGLTDDGQGECTATQDCCFTGCKDVQTDANNCGDCGTRCSDRPDTNVCVDGECVCGNTGGPCPPNNDPCLMNSCTAGGCAPTPVTGCCTTATQCNDGNLCTRDGCQDNRCENLWISGCCRTHADCDDGDPCTEDSCNTGQNTCKPPKVVC
ncbi:MAG: hypothetical protein JRH20_22965, partial [Deltaproteobacteria bacterium]|nr:hypothetical protein [Deltaproteobacteria bacterium]